MTTRYLFVGERPSPKAILMGVAWENGKLAAKQLFDALVFCGLDPCDPDQCRYINWWQPRTDRYVPQKGILILIRGFALTRTIVAMGDKVARRLAHFGVPHVKIVHPAARGSIRKKERYCNHVREIIALSASRKRS